MVSDNKEELKNVIEIESESLSEEAEIKRKLDAVMKAKAKQYAKAKLEAEKKAKQKILEEKEKERKEKLAAEERILAEKRAREAAAEAERKAREEAAEAERRAREEAAEAERRAREEAAEAERRVREEAAEAERRAREEAANEREKIKQEIEASRRADERVVAEKKKKQEAEKKAADMRLRVLAAKKAAEKTRDENMARKAVHTMDEAAKAAAARMKVAEEEKELARQAEIAELERIIHKLEEEKKLATELNGDEAQQHVVLTGTDENDNKVDGGFEQTVMSTEQERERVHVEAWNKNRDNGNDDSSATQTNSKKAGGVKKGGFRDKLGSVFAAPIFLHDRIQDACDNFLEKLYRDIVSAVYKIVRGYRASQRTIGLSLLAVCAVCGVIVTILNSNTVYEYAYNGKVLGYVENQDDVTNVLAIAGEKLNSINNESAESIEFSAGDNITFNVVDGNGKDIDDADDTINKLAYMTDIEVEAYGIYESDKLVTIVKSKDAAEKLLEEVKSILGTPDEGMEVVSVDFNKALTIEPINVLLTSVQSNSAATKQMTEGDDVEFYHLVEADETMESIREDFSAGAMDIYDEENENVVDEVDVGDKICIRKTVEPVSVKLVEEGKMKEIVPYEIIEKETKEYYKGDEVIDVNGVDGIQIFEGTVTKVGGKVTKRKTKNLEIIREKVDEVILIGTAKRPKTAPTGIFKNPMMPGTYVITSHMGYRWGRQHEGVDMGASVGTAVYASDGGTVSFAGVSGGYGNLVIIDHGNGTETRYGHLSSIGVTQGQKVYQGQYIAASGNTGRSTGPHLHFEIRIDGTPINPETKVSGGL